MEYENARRISYPDPDGYFGEAVFVPVCENCGRFVKADASIFLNEIEGLSKEPNATCAKCGRIHMLFEGFL